MPTVAYIDGGLKIKQAKTGARVRVTPAPELLPLLEEAKAEMRLRVLVNTFGQQWTSSGFRASFRREPKWLQIKG